MPAKEIKQIIRQLNVKNNIGRKLQAIWSKCESQILYILIKHIQEDPLVIVPLQMVEELFVSI